MLENEENELNNIVPRREEIEANEALCHSEKELGKTIVQSAPKTLTIETTGVCNLKCVMCPHGLQGNEEQWEHFPEENADKLRDVIRLASNVQLHSGGEPLMNPAFWRMLEMTHENQHSIINSNGLLLTKEHADRILLTSLGEISFSLDAATDETYRKIRGANFKQVINNIKYVIDERNRRGREKPIIRINMTLMRENVEEARMFVELAHEIGANGVQFGHMNWKSDDEHWVVTRGDWTFVYQDQMLSRYPKLSNAMIRQATERAEELGMEFYIDWAKPVFFDEEPTVDLPHEPEKQENGEGETAGPQVKDCDTPWSWMLIKTDGSIYPCCYGLKPIGNLKDQDPLEVWNNETTKSLRTYINNNRVHPVCSYGFCKFVDKSPSYDEMKWEWFTKRYRGSKKFLKQYRFARNVNRLLKKMMGK